MLFRAYLLSFDEVFFYLTAVSRYRLAKATEAALIRVYSRNSRLN